MTLLRLGRRLDTRWVLEPAFVKMLAHYLNDRLAQSTGQRIRFEPMSDSQLPTTASLPSRLLLMYQRPAPMNLAGPGCLSAQHFRCGFPQWSSPAARRPPSWGRQECRREAGAFGQVYGCWSAPAPCGSNKKVITLAPRLSPDSLNNSRRLSAPPACLLVARCSMPAANLTICLFL